MCDKCSMSVFHSTRNRQLKEMRDDINHKLLFGSIVVNMDDLLKDVRTPFTEEQEEYITDYSRWLNNKAIAIVWYTDRELREKVYNLEVDIQDIIESEIDSLFTIDEEEHIENQDKSVYPYSALYFYNMEVGIQQIIIEEVAYLESYHNSQVHEQKHIEDEIDSMEWSHQDEVFKQDQIRRNLVVEDPGWLERRMNSVLAQVNNLIKYKDKYNMYGLDASVWNTEVDKLQAKSNLMIDDAAKQVYPRILTFKEADGVLAKERDRWEAKTLLNLKPRSEYAKWAKEMKKVYAEREKMFDDAVNLTQYDDAMEYLDKLKVPGGALTLRGRINMLVVHKNDEIDLLRIKADEHAELSNYLSEIKIPGTNAIGRLTLIDRVNAMVGILLAEQDKERAKVLPTKDMTFAQAMEHMKNGKEAMSPVVHMEDVSIGIQFPDEDSKMTEPYFYLRHGAGVEPFVLSAEEALATDWMVVNV